MAWRENTLAGVDSAVECGADWVEVDVKLTRDGRLVLLHDATLQRLWNDTGVVASLTLAELAFRIGVPAGYVPTLDDALERSRVHGVPLMVDISTPAEGDAVRAVVAAADGWDRVVLAGDPSALARIRSAAPHANIAMSWELRELPTDSLLERVRPDCFNQLHTLLDTTVVERVHERGMTVCAYTVDDAARVRELAAMGVDAVISNDIRLLRATLATPEVTAHGAH